MHAQFASYAPLVTTGGKVSPLFSCRRLYLSFRGPGLLVSCERLLLLLLLLACALQ